jgi:hypothetical protein
MSGTKAYTVQGLHSLASLIRRIAEENDRLDSKRPALSIINRPDGYELHVQEN